MKTSANPISRSILMPSVSPNVSRKRPMKSGQSVDDCGPLHVGCWTAPPAGDGGCPCRESPGCHPDRQAPALPKSPVVLSPVLDLVLGLRDPVTARFIVLIRHAGTRRRSSPLYRLRRRPAPRTGFMRQRQPTLLASGVSRFHHPHPAATRAPWSLAQTGLVVSANYMGCVVTP